ncbi:ankyrin repeat domain-containing protein 26-like isoform X3 [Bos javanicus]|nr:ankyrin repeat domain-containing protein 26-like isoform X3 [Bos javanicus]
MTEASLEVMARNCANLEDEAQDLKSKLHQLPSQLQEAQDQHIEAVRCTEKTQDHIQKLEIENAKLQTTVKKQVDKIEQLQKNLFSTRLVYLCTEQNVGRSLWSHFCCLGSGEWLWPDVHWGAIFDHHCKFTISYCR